MTTAREEIIANFATTIAGISVAGGYNTTTATVERRERNQAEMQRLKRTAMPFYAVVPGIEWEYSQEPFNAYVVRELIGVRAHLPTSDNPALENRDVSRARIDLIRAVQADTTRGGYARWTKPEGGRSEEGAPTSTEVGGSIASFEQRFWVEYEDVQT